MFLDPNGHLGFDLDSPMRDLDSFVWFLSPLLVLLLFPQIVQPSSLPVGVLVKKKWSEQEGLSVHASKAEQGALKGLAFSTTVVVGSGLARMGCK